MKPAIVIENLGKRYRVNHERVHGYKTLRESLTDAITGPLRRFRNGGSGTSVEDFWAIKDVSFEVQPGEVVGIIGRNGAGKSTLLKILSRITKPTTGQVRLNGRVASLLEVGTGFHPELTGRENIFLNGAILGMGKEEIRRQFDAIVDFSGVEKFLDTPVKRYSSGMHVRLAFAVAAHLQPEILIVDEVLAVGDVAFQQKCLGKIGEVASSGRTVLLVSHQLPSVEKLCTKAVLMSGGKVVSMGDAGEIITRYLSGVQDAATASYRADGEGKEAAYLVAADVLDSEGTPTALLRFAEPFAIRMHWRNKLDLRGVVYSVRVFDNQRRAVFAANTRSQEQLELDTAGDHIVAAEFPTNILPPGQYTATITAWQFHTGVIKAFNHCVKITVDSVPYFADFSYETSGTDAAAVRAAWKMEPAMTSGNPAAAPGKPVIVSGSAVAAREG